jgi:Fe2+ or Zn2+ uptake regulation protein
MDAQAIKQSLEGRGLRCTTQRYAVMEFLIDHNLEGMRHHHFVCDRCGNVEDVEWYDVPRPASRSLGKRIVRECQLIFRGLCPKCAPRRASR